MAAYYYHYLFLYTHCNVFCFYIYHYKNLFIISELTNIIIQIINVIVSRFFILYLNEYFILNHYFVYLILKANNYNSFLTYNAIELIINYS